MSDTYAPGATMGPAELAALIDHALLKPELTGQEVAVATAELAQRNIFSVCVRPVDVALAAAAIPASSSTVVCTVIGFPHGSTSTAAKVAEAEQALKDGARELDMVIQIGHLLGGDDELVRADIEAVVAAGHEQDALVKVILETSLLTEEAKVRGCQLAAEAGADFVKTSTGFAGGGATVPDIRLMRASVPASVAVKASGGVRTLDALLAVVAAGATRIGASSTAELLAELEQRGGSVVIPRDDEWVPSEADSRY